MIKLYINGELREDVWIQTGGTLEQTEEHATESNISVKVPITSDNLAVYDYVQIYDDDTIIFAGNILSLNQQMIDSGYTGLDFRMYDLVMACNADLVATVLVDTAFPAGATITQILKGNHKGDAWYNEKLGEFEGIVLLRIVPEGITVGTVEDYNALVLDGTSYFWGETVKSLLNNLAEITQSYWEITNEKIFNFKRKSSASKAPFNLSQESNIFDLEVESDGLATYSAVRVIGGEGEVLINAIYSTSESAYFRVVTDTMIESKYSIARIEGVQLIDTLTGGVAYVEVGYKGIHDDSPQFGALITYGGKTIEIKERFLFLPNGGSIYNCYVTQPITVRTISQEAVERIKTLRGGTGIVEYVLEDKTISNFNDAVLNAQSFLSKHENNTQTVKFSTFTPGFSVGQYLTGNIPYYKVSGTYYTTGVTASFLYDTSKRLFCRYDVELSSSIFRDVYKTLFYTPMVLSFDIGDASGNVNSFTYHVEIDIKVTFATQVSNIPTWGEVDGDQWATINGRTWFEFYRFSEGVSFTGNYTTEKIRNLFAQFAQGDIFKGSNVNYEALGEKAVDLQMCQALQISGNGGGTSIVSPVQSTTPITNTTFSNSYYVAENEAEMLIEDISMRGVGTNVYQYPVVIPVNIDKSPSNPQGQYAMSIAITIDFQ